MKAESCSSDGGQMNLELARAILADDQPCNVRERAAVFVTTHELLHTPERLSSTVDFVREVASRHYRKRPGLVSERQFGDRILLASTMGATDLMVARQAIDNFIKTNFVPLGPPDVYDTTHRDGATDEAVTLESDPFKHAFMCSIMGLLQAGHDISEQSKDPGSHHAPYTQIWQLEVTTRQNLPDVTHHRNTQRRRTDDFHPLQPEILQLSMAKFLRNIMHYFVKISDQAPDASIEELQAYVTLFVDAAETAAQYPREVQRACMGQHGDSYETFRQKQGVIPNIQAPELIRDAHQARFVGLEGSSSRHSMCSGQDRHELPEFLYRESDRLKCVSVIGMLTLWSALTSPATLFAGRSHSRVWPYNHE